MSQAALTPATVPQTYAQLRRAVETAMIKGQQAVDLAKVRTYHETGRLINEHVLLFKERADYGAKTIQRLADDLKVHRSVLQRCVQFAREIPICAGRRKLTWAHYRTLLPVEDAARRNALATEADKKGWTAEQLEQRIRTLVPPEEAAKPAADGTPPPKPLTPKRGIPGLHLIVERDGQPAIDLGFKRYRPLDAEIARWCGKDDIVQLGDDGAVARASDATKAQLFTYAATIRRVVDGDTLVIAVAVRPDVVLEEKLRLRGLDCPEMDTPEGKAAKRFVEALVARAKGVIITTFKPDKYDRYLTDVFLEVDGEEGRAQQDCAPAGEIFLNNALLANGHAVRMDEYALTDWAGG